MKANYKQLQRLQRSEIEHRRAVYGWNHPENIAWAESQGEPLRAYCRPIEDQLRALQAENRQRVADLPARPQSGGISRPVSNRPYLEDISLPGHRDRPSMFIEEKAWLVDPANRETVKKLWARLRAAPPTICGGYGFLIGEEMEDDGVPEILVAHWRHIEYTDTGERIEQIPGGMVARDLNRLGLTFRDVEAGTVVTPQRRPAQGYQPRANPASRPGRTTHRRKQSPPKRIVSNGTNGRSAPISIQWEKHHG